MCLRDSKFRDEARKSPRVLEQVLDTLKYINTTRDKVSLGFPWYEYLVYVGVKQGFLKVCFFKKRLENANTNLLLIFFLSIPPS